jgi:hypothetical protein
MNANDKKIQELARILDATLAQVNVSGLSDGTNALQIIKFLNSFDNMDKFISPEFKETIEQQISMSYSKKNVREHIKKIYTFPLNTYLPWVNINIDFNTMDKLKKIITEISFKLKIHDGKVYAFPNTDIKHIVYNELKPFLPSNIIEHNEITHLSIINSNIVYDCGLEEIQKFNLQYTDPFIVNIIGVNSTISNDWAPFSKCYVIVFESDYIDKYVHDFNNKFDKQINISKHMTFGIISRSLWD